MRSKKNSEPSFEHLKKEVEGAAFVADRLHLDIAFVQHHNLFAKAQADAAAVLPGAEKGYEDLVD